MLHKLPELSPRQFFRYVARYIRESPASTRAVKPANRIRTPADQGGVGVFFFPADSWSKKRAFAVGPLGETDTFLHTSKFQITRPLTGDEGIAQPDILYWGIGGAVRMTKNALSGVTEGFAVNLELHGVGFRVEEDKERGLAIFRLGFSHVIEMPMVHKDDGVFFNIINPQLLQVAGLNREKVHQLASKVRALRPPEPYKGKGIRYKSEPIRRKETRKD